MCVSVDNYLFYCFFKIISIHIIYYYITFTSTFSYITTMCTLDIPGPGETQRFTL
jgi:hypothetical protein